MREIEFRAKSKVTGEWVIGDLVQFDDNSICIRNWIDVGCHEVIPDSVGEYTGLEDKNGRKIFEGDILQAGDRHHSYRFVVKFGEYDECHVGFYAECPSEDFYRNDLAWWVCNRNAVVVGNLFDNPELVEGSEDGAD